MSIKTLLTDLLKIIEGTYPADEDNPPLSGADVVDELLSLEQRVRDALQETDT